MLGILIFLSSVFVVSFSGAIAPGPVTAATINLGVRQKYAGALLAVGHGIIEVPLILLIVSGLGGFLNLEPVRAVIGLAGGTLLIWTAVQMFKDTRKAGYFQSGGIAKSPVSAGIVLSASNPYFLLWWITVGVKFASDALSFGWIVLAVFIFVHWFADLIWFQALSFASRKGATVLSERKLMLVLSVCAAALLFFGAYFLFDAVKMLIS